MTPKNVFAENNYFGVGLGRSQIFVWTVSPSLAHEVYVFGKHAFGSQPFSPKLQFLYTVYNHILPGGRLQKDYVLLE